MQWTHHERDLLIGLRLSADEEDTAAEEDETDGQRGQHPDLQCQDGVPVVCGQVADYANNDHCTHTHTHTHTRTKCFRGTGLLYWVITVIFVSLNAFIRIFRKVAVVVFRS